MSSSTHQINVLIGQVHVARPPDRLYTVVGSCIAVVLFDPNAHVAGMAHVLLPDSRGGASNGLPGKYADQAVPALLDALIAFGARRTNLKAMFAGGGAFHDQLVQGEPMGERNVKAIRKALAGQAIEAVTTDTGGRHGRRVWFDPNTGELQIEKLKDYQDGTRVA
ncbi:MAG: chemotaxis protein CheD [Planctomycetota bacterium]|jgi:chemotaxis protein CheD|nr:chemotaxis protein CheD [Planctomycetota bacterium]